MNTWVDWVAKAYEAANPGVTIKYEERTDTDITTAFADVQDAVVYAVTRALAENKQYFETVHSGFKHWNPEQMPGDGEVPIHEGAMRYYKETGWIAR